MALQQVKKELKTAFGKLSKPDGNTLLRTFALSKKDFNSFVNSKTLEGKSKPYSPTIDKVESVAKELGLELSITKTK
jgi:hypothetical protein